MRSRTVCLAAVLVVAGAATLQAATTDIRTVRSILTLAPACTGTPLQGQPACLKVVVQNLGPDTYVGTGPGKMAGMAAAGRLTISVDIDEPTKPTGPDQPPRIAVTFTRDFAVTIAPGDSATLDFGPIGWKPATAGTHSARATALAQAPNVDPNSANNTATTIFHVNPFPVPVAGAAALVVLAAGVAGAAGWSVRRRRRRRLPA